MDPAVADANLYEYDADYDTRTNSNYGRSYIGIILGILLVLIGILLCAMSLGDMNQGITRFIWTENPFWPSYGKGVWVGLLTIGVGVLGIIAHCEDTHTAIKGFGISALVDSILLFYLVISTIIYIQFGQRARSTSTENTKAIYNTYAYNSALAGFSSFAFLLTSIGGALSLAFTNTYSNSRFDPAK